MRIFPTQVGPGGEPISDTASWTSSNANDSLQETQNAVTSSGQTLIPLANPANNTQLSQALARYASGGIFGVDSGAADAYVISATGSFTAPTAYFDGMVIQFYASNASTTASTVNAFAIGVVDLVQENGTALTAAFIDVIALNKATYDAGAGKFFVNDAAGIGVGTPNVMGQNTLYVSTTDTAAAGDVVIADTSGGAFTVNLPITPSQGDYVRFDVGSDYSANTLTVGRNGETIMGGAADMTITTNNPIALRYNGTDWRTA